MRLHRLRLHRLPLLFLLGFFSAMVIIGAIPGEANALSSRFGDKFLHALAYAFMTVLAWRSLVAPRMLRMLASVGFVALLGLIDESIQAFLPYRNASLLDWCFDVGAALVVTSLFSLRSNNAPETN